MILKSNDFIFSDISSLLEFLLEYEVIPLSIICVCGGQMAIQQASRGNISFLQYRCKITICRKRKAICNSKLGICRWLFVVYYLMSGCTYKQVELYTGVGNMTIWRIRQQLKNAYAQYINQHPVFLGGLNVIVEVDESVLSRRGIIRSPTSTADDTQGTIWILGAIDNTPERNFTIFRVPDRTSTTITRYFEGIIRVGSILHSDGYPSYPSVANNLSIEHHVVNHSRGFISPDGTHTNNIEGFWAHMKSTMRKESGVKRDIIDDWIAEYTFKRRYLVNATPEEFTDYFIKICRELLK